MGSNYEVTRYLPTWPMKCVHSFYSAGYDGKMVQNSIVLPPFIEH